MGTSFRELLAKLRKTVTFAARHRPLRSRRDVSKGGSGTLARKHQTRPDPLPGSVVDGGPTTELLTAAYSRFSLGLQVTNGIQRD
jgi:hypothetical protein